MTIKARIERWQRRLSGLTELQLPTDYPRPFPLQVVNNECSYRLNQHTALALIRLSLSATNDAHPLPPSPFTIILSAFTLLLYRYTGDSDIVVGSSSITTNPLPLRVQFDPSDTLEQVIRHVQQARVLYAH
jgi:L-aminoadipate-semialdehyde dehydrogenase